MCDVKGTASIVASVNVPVAAGALGWARAGPRLAGASGGWGGGSGGVTPSPGLMPRAASRRGPVRGDGVGGKPPTIRSRIGANDPRGTVTSAFGDVTAR